MWNERGSLGTSRAAIRGNARTPCWHRPSNAYPSPLHRADERHHGPPRAELTLVALRITVSVLHSFELAVFRQPHRRLLLGHHLAQPSLGPHLAKILGSSERPPIAKAPPNRANTS